MSGPRGTSRPLRAVLAVAAATALMLVAAPAVAHDELLASDPADGATVTDGPAELLLTFSAEVVELGAAVQVLDGGGADWADGQPEVDGVQVVQPLRGGMAAGVYSVAWRVASSDGHPVSGLLSFTVTEGQASPPGDEQTALPSDDAGDAVTPSVAPAPGAGGTEPTGTTAPEATATAAPEERSAPTVPWPVGAGLVVLLVAASSAVVLLLRRRAARGSDRQP